MNTSQNTNCQFNVPRWIMSIVIASLLIVFVSPTDGFAQRRKSALGDDKNTNTKDDGKSPSNQPNSATPSSPKNSTPNNSTAKPANQKNKANEFAPQIVTMEVKPEGIQLVGTWFPPIIEEDKKSKNKKKVAEPNTDKDAKNETADKETADKELGKSVAPFILVHDWTRNRNDLLQLGFFLQSKGHAVIVPDLRGHGQSVRAVGSSRPLDHKKFRKAEKGSAIRDIDQCKRFLLEKNNEGVVNIDLLNVVAVGDSSHLAISWAITDWSWEPAAGIKQGKDVKSLILFSPTKNFAGSDLKKLALQPLVSGRHSTPLPMLVVWGGKADNAEDCEDFVDLLRKHRPEAAEGGSLAQRWQSQNLFHFEAPTQMAGYQLAGNPNAARIWSFANDFVSQKVLAYKDQCPWQIRGAEAVLKAREEAEGAQTQTNPEPKIEGEEK